MVIEQRTALIEAFLLVFDEPDGPVAGQGRLISEKVGGVEACRWLIEACLLVLNERGGVLDAAGEVYGRVERLNLR